MPNSLATEADILLAGYRTGYYTVDDVISWADRWILALDEPPTALLDLSVGRHLHPQEVKALLRCLADNNERRIVAAELAMIGTRLREGEIGITDARDLLWPLHDHPDATDEEIMVAYDVADSISYALYEGIGDLQEVETRLSEFLTRYIDQLTLNDDLQVRYRSGPK